jgi:hypothetical protein
MATEMLPDGLWELLEPFTGGHLATDPLLFAGLARPLRAD